MKPDLILIAEDNDDHAFLLKRALHKGAVLNPVFIVSDGEEAIAYLKGEGKFSDRYEYPLPGLLLLDLKMPKKDGFEVLQWIRLQPCLRRLRVVVLTTSDDPRDIDHAYELGANSFMIKPLEKQQFLEVTEAIKGYWLWMSAAPALQPSGSQTPVSTAHRNIEPVPSLNGDRNGETSAPEKEHIRIPDPRCL